jgi:hypothetical protein
MIEACLSLSEAETDIAVALDLDDPALPGYEAAPRLLTGNGVSYFKGQRIGLGASTNLVADLKHGDYRALASLGDDHMPRTQGWDRLLLKALDDIGGEGIAYGDDLHQGSRLPTAPVISAGIVEALGWMCEPSLRHFCVDAVWRDLGEQAGCLRYAPDVVIEHMHPHAGKGPRDATYLEVGETSGRLEPDSGAYQAWRRERMAADVAKVRAVMATSPVRGGA